MVGLLWQVLRLLHQVLSATLACACHLVTLHYYCDAFPGHQQEEEDDSKRRRKWRRRRRRGVLDVPGPVAVPVFGSLWSTVSWLGGPYAGMEYHKVCEKR